MDGLVFFGCLMFAIILSYLLVIVISDARCRRYARSLFVSGYVVEVYVMNGKVRPTVYKKSRYFVCDVRDDYVLLRDIDTGEESECRMCDLIEESDRLIVYDGSGGKVEDIYNYPYPCE